MTDSRQDRVRTDLSTPHSENPTKAWLRSIAREVVRRLVDTSPLPVRKAKRDVPTNGSTIT